MPTKIYRIKMNDFWINVSYSPPHYPRQETKLIERSVIMYPAIEFEWIAIEMSEVCAVEREQFLWF